MRNFTKRRKSAGSRCVLLAALLAISTRSEGQTLLYEEGFGSGAAGWTAQEYNSFCPIGNFVRDVSDVSVVSSGGVTGPFLRVIEPAVGDSAYLRAPSLLVQRLADASEGWLTYERRLERVTGSLFSGVQDEVTIVGNGLTLISTGGVLSPGLWRSRVIPLVPSAWRVGSCSGRVATQAEFDAVLRTATALYLTCEHVDGREINDIDSIRLWGPPVASCGEGWRWIDNVEPTARWGHAASLDTARNVIVVYGGYSGESDTWEYTPQANGSGTWRRTATAGPGPKANAALVYDAARGCTVLIGGFFAPVAGFPEYQASAEVWEYRSNGVTGVWTRSPGSLPQPRESIRAVYDTVRSAIVAYGGPASGAGATDVLERGPNSDAWSSITTTVNPGPQRGHAMAFDTVRGVAYLVAPGSTNVEVWAWTPTASPPTWTPILAADAPSSRFRTGLAFDPRPSRAVLTMIGGESGDTDFRGTFDFNPAAPGGPAWFARASIRSGGAEAFRTRHAMSWDPVGNQMLLFGGVAGETNPQRQVLSYNGVTNSWVDRWNTFAVPPRDFAAIAFDETGQRTIVAGGGLMTRPGAAPSRQLGSGVFAWDGTSWSGLASTPQNQAFWKASMVYVPTTNPPSMFVYGGEVNAVGNAAVSAQVWRLDLGPTPVWSTRTTMAPGGRRAVYGAAFDRRLGRIVYFGGRDETGAFRNDTWLVDPITDQWTLVDPPIKPSPRNGPGIAFDERRGVTVLFGGATAAGVYDGSTWEFDGTAWRDVTPPDGGPTPRALAALTYVPDRGTIVLTGGEGTNSVNARALDDVWEYDGVAWRRLLVGSTEPSIGNAYAAHTYDRTRQRVVRFGGSAITFPQSGTDYFWFLNAQTWTMQVPDVSRVLQHPTATNACPGESVQLAVRTSRPGTDSYMWRFNGDPIDPGHNPSAITSSLVLTNVSSEQSGFYDCVVASTCGSVLSSAVLVSIPSCCSLADINNDGLVDLADFFDFFNCFSDGTACADLDQSGEVDLADFFEFFNAFSAGC